MLDLTVVAVYCLLDVVFADIHLLRIGDFVWFVPVGLNFGYLV